MNPDDYEFGGYCWDYADRHKMLEKRKAERLAFETLHRKKHSASGKRKRKMTKISRVKNR